MTTSTVFRELLCTHFQNIACWTWEALRLGQAHHLTLGEESLTDVNLLRIQIAHWPHVKVHKYSKAEEHNETGADWEWWFGSSVSQQWRRIWVQAKKLYREGTSYTYSELNESQARTLLTEARKPQIGAVPMYCFYNYWDANNISARVPRYACRCGASQRMPKVQGCTLAAAEDIMPLPKPRAFRPLHKVAGKSAPWHCLICSEVPTGQAMTLIDVVEMGLQRAFGVEGLPPRWYGPLPDYVEGAPPDYGRDAPPVDARTIPRRVMVIDSLDE